MENKQLRRTITSLSKATAAERETYKALERDLEGYQLAVSSISREYQKTSRFHNHLTPHAHTSAPLSLQLSRTRTLFTHHSRTSCKRFLPLI